VGDTRDSLAWLRLPAEQTTEITPIKEKLEATGPMRRVEKSDRVANTKP
jgi:hypothetical protein